MRHPLGLFLRASTVHIGAAAATAALRAELVRQKELDASEIDAAYAVSRITPGTNLLALYAQLGYQLGGWWLAVQAVAVGAFVPAVAAVAVAVLYQHSNSPAGTAIMKGARAGGVAVFLGAAVRLVRPQIVDHPQFGTVLAAMVVLVAWFLHAPIAAVLLLCGLVGAVGLRPR